MDINITNIIPVIPNDFANYSKQKPSTLIVVDFNAKWCLPCKNIKPFIIYLRDNYPNVEFHELDIEDDDNAELVSQFKITKVPTFLYYKNGMPCKFLIGTNTEKLEEYVNEYL